VTLQLKRVVKRSSTVGCNCSSFTLSLSVEVKEITGWRFLIHGPEGSALGCFGVTSDSERSVAGGCKFGSAL